MIAAKEYFFIHSNIKVDVTKLSDRKFRAILHWLPYWLPNIEIEQHLNFLLEAPVTISYVRLPQPGYRGCFSTQRRVESVADLDALPHFLRVPFEGKYYKAYVFVPGRPQMCFQCGQRGHMRSDCSRNHPEEIIKTVVQSPSNISLPTLSGDATPAPTPLESDMDSELESVVCIINTKQPSDNNMMKENDQIIAFVPSTRDFVSDAHIRPMSQNCTPESSCYTNVKNHKQQFQ